MINHRKKPKFIPFLLFLAILYNFQFSVAYAECSTSANSFKSKKNVCVDVYTENGQLVIEAKKSGATSSPKPRVASTSASKPKPTLTRKYTYKPRTTSPKLRIKSRPKSRTTTGSSSNSLADKILQSLPTLQVAYQPDGKVLPKIPVIFFTDLPTFFNKDYRILGQKISVNVKPNSLWSFGDGSILITSKAGKPYPSTEITHSYSVPGTYTVAIATIWTGDFTVDGQTIPIKGAIRQYTAVDVKVVGAGTKFVGK